MRFREAFTGIMKRQPRFRNQCGTGSPFASHAQAENESKYYKLSQSLGEFTRSGKQRIRNYAQGEGKFSSPFVRYEPKKHSPNPRCYKYYCRKQPSLMNLRTVNDSPAKNKGNTSTAASVPKDIKGVSRTSNPTIGAYQ